MWSSGRALSQTVVALRHNSSYVSASFTMLPPVASTALLTVTDQLSQAPRARDAGRRPRRAARTPLPRSCPRASSTSWSSSTNDSRAARELRPIVLLPAPRRPSSATNCRRRASPTPASKLGRAWCRGRLATSHRRATEMLPSPASSGDEEARAHPGALHQRVQREAAARAGGRARRGRGACSTSLRELSCLCNIMQCSSGYLMHNTACLIGNQFG